MINPSYGEERERERGGVVQIIARLRLNLPSVYIGGRSDTEREREREARADDDATVTVGKLPSYDESGWRR